MDWQGCRRNECCRTKGCRICRRTEGCWSIKGCQGCMINMGCQVYRRIKGCWSSRGSQVQGDKGLPENQGLARSMVCPQTVREKNVLNLEGTVPAFSRCCPVAYHVARLWPRSAGMFTALLLDRAIGGSRWRMLSSCGIVRTWSYGNVFHVVWSPRHDWGEYYGAPYCSRSWEQSSWSRDLNST